jgi:hypothetical protein
LAPVRMSNWSSLDTSALNPMSYPKWRWTHSFVKRSCKLSQWETTWHTPVLHTKMSCNHPSKVYMHTYIQKATSYT